MLEIIFDVLNVVYRALHIVWALIILFIVIISFIARNKQKGGRHHA